MKRFWTALTLVLFFVLTVGSAQISFADTSYSTSQSIADGIHGTPPSTPVRAVFPALSVYHVQGADLYNRGAFGAAIIEFNKQLEYNPEDVAALVNRGISYARRGEYKYAIENLFAALNLRNNDVTILNYIAAVYYLDREYLKSFDIYEKATTLENNNYDAIAGKGCALMELEKHGLAITEFTRALYLIPDDVRSFIGRGISLNATEKYKAALADLDKAISLSSNEPFIYLLRAESNSGITAFSSAVSDLKRACSLNYTAVCVAMKKSKTELAASAQSFALQYSARGPDQELYDSSRKKLDRFYNSKRATELRKYFVRQLVPIKN